MKAAIISVAAAALFELAVAQPHRGMQHAHREVHAKRDEDVVYVTATQTVYAAPSEVVVVVADQFGNPISTYTSTGVASAYSVSEPSSTQAGAAFFTQPSSSSTYTPTPSSTYVPPSSSSTYVPPSSTYVPPSSTYVPPSSTYVPPSSTYVPSSSSVATSSAAPSVGGGAGFGIAYSPYNSDGSCKTQDQVNEDFQSIGGKYAMVRTYGTDCNQVETVLNAATPYGMKLFAGIYDIFDLENETNLIISAANGDYSNIDTISVGNEVVNSGTADAGTVVAAIQTVRGIMSNAGYNGYVVTSDTLVATREYPELCDNSDYCTVNCHPFFDGGVAADGSGEFLIQQSATLAAVLANPNQRIMISETGWPWQGETNGEAVPSVANQAAALSSIMGSYSSNPDNIMLFTAFNDYWKTSDASQFDAEPYWGILGDCPSG